ncbi:MAG TPA: putative 2OG-Fe(II) oxygenase [Qipengyuania sp.]|nr:putative 2OG-Fe(II) oxygenase [Qipengyuania sp.]
MNRLQAETTAAGLSELVPDAAFTAGLALLRADFPELLLPAAQRLADRHRGDPRMAQLLGLAARAAGDGPLAHLAFRRAAALAPRDPLIAHSHARAVLEAGHPAVAPFETARRLAPKDGTVIQGLAAALVAENRAGEAVTLLEEILVSSPLWLEGHDTLAQIRGQHGGDVTGSLDSALTGLPAHPDLHRMRIGILLKSRRTIEVPATIAAAESVLGAQSWLEWYRGHVASELGMVDAADRAFAAAPPPATGADVALLARHALRAGRPEQAKELIEPWLGHDPDNTLWPYAALAWRLTDDPRIQWLQEDELVGIYDLADRIGNLTGLSDLLRALHTAREAPLDQSVRGGTQTDGNLLLRDNPQIQALRHVVLEAVARHVARLPEKRPGHPTLIAERRPLRITGSWSVRLQGAGFHADHVHTQGWLSSALYVALPESVGASTTSEQSGWLSLGECRELLPGLAPERLVKPKPGRLVLFPSTMWHGTRPFPAGERLTIAFDIARPKQD